MAYYAHSLGTDKSRWQTIQQHLENTAEQAREIGGDTGLADFAAAAALFHDIGKYSQAFQHRLEGGPVVDHASAGAQLADKLLRQRGQGLFGRMLAYCITGHHSGLLDAGSPVDTADDGTLAARLKKEPQNYSAYAQELDLGRLVLPPRFPAGFRPLDRQHQGFSIAFAVRMIFSTLVDADFLETEGFYNGGQLSRGAYAPIPTLEQQYFTFLRRFDAPTSAINRQRSATLQECVARAEQPPGLYTLTLPTGAGKTYASLAFALRHAARHGLKRIIYIIPYTSIIEQNAAVIQNSLGELRGHVLEHHSNFDWEKHNPTTGGEDSGPAGSLVAKLRRAAENWDIPIVVTTSVQFFESLYASRTSRSRKVHNLARSVLIFDEAQMLPRDFLRPCLYAVTELVQNYGASAVFCTATQPALETFLPEGARLSELIADPQEQFDFYRRVQVRKLGRVSDDQLLERLNQHSQALCIVNTRRHARALYEGLTGEGRFHLSTLMCPAHRSRVIAEIRARLKSKQPCRVISTQLLEAGVDLDFPVGYRALAGLESIIQAGGRVNREKCQPSGDLFVFEPDSPHARFLPGYIRQTAAVARLVLDHYEDPVCIEAVGEYYRRLYTIMDPQAADRERILDCFPNSADPLQFNFQTAAEKFRLIEEDTYPVILPYDETARSLIRALQTAELPLPLIRRLQSYTVSIYEKEYQVLDALGTLDHYHERFAVLRDPALYHDQTGLTLPDTGPGQAVFTNF